MTTSTDGELVDKLATRSNKDNRPAITTSSSTVEPTADTTTTTTATTSTTTGTGTSGYSGENTISNKAQTRFNFYNAAEVHTATNLANCVISTSTNTINGNGNTNTNTNINSTINVNKNSNKNDNSAPNRFNFYNPEEVQKASTSALTLTPASASASALISGAPTPIDLTAALGGNNTKTATEVRSNHAETPDDANEILRSLQETEREQQHKQYKQKGGTRRGRLTAAATNSTSTSTSMNNIIHNNPYETAIHDALAMLRQKSSSYEQQHNDKIMESREATYSEIRDADQRNRDERLAKYAAKLVEAHGKSLPPLSPESIQHDDDTHATITTTAAAATPTTAAADTDTNTDTDNTTVSFPKVNKDRMEELFRARVEDDVDISPLQQSQLALLGKQQQDDNVDDNVDDDDDDDDDDNDATTTTTRNVDQEIQKGVERVLMAILERAHSTDELSVTVDAANANKSADSLTQALSFLTGNGADVENPLKRGVNPPSRRVAEEYLTDDEGETDDDDDDEDDDDDDDDDIDDATTIDNTATIDVDVSVASTTNKQQRSVVDELLAEDEQATTMQGNQRQPKKHPNSSDDIIIPTSTMVEMPTSPQSIYSKLTTEEESQGMLNEDSSGGTAIDDDDDADADDLLNQSHSLTQVLGPLSGNDTTGVVLEESDTVADNDDLFHAMDDDDKSESPSSMLESISKSVKDAESFMSYMTGGAVSPTTEISATTRKDKYLTEKEIAEADNGDDVSLDAEANELMRSLCAHLLPYGVDKSTKHLSEIPPWDDRNPNEPGYRIIRLSKSQLKRVEREFERMVNGVLLSSERHLGSSSKGGLTAKDARNDWNGVAGADFGEDENDQRFEKDLEEAEDLLEREEKLRATAEKVMKISKDSSDEESVVTEDAENHLDSHPDFPGIRRSGKGEMGDLEYFSLPIIFKSHVTGFEPTKDLFLEPGNVVAGQYLVENELGTAAFSTAYRCIDLNSDAAGNGDFHEEVCLKVIKNTKDFFDQSLDEIKILELLRQTGKCHQHNIVEMKTFFYHREHLVIVTELLRQNLFEFGKFIIDNNEEPYFTRRRLCYMTRQVLAALKFVHNLGLVHSDIKPENILLSSYSRAKVKVIDFGSSCYLTDRQSSYIQSRSYRAPEVVLGLPYDGKIDVWSLGCVVAEMYTSEVTFQNDSIVSMLSRIEAICGAFPRHMIAQGRQSNRFFTKSGLLYELVEPDERRTNPVQDDDESGLFDVFQPKRTTMASRLGYDPQALQQAATHEDQDQALFVDFIRSVLTIDPDSRPTAAQALRHPWIVSGESLAEEDIKYPSS